MRSVYRGRHLSDEEVTTWARLGGAVLLFLALGQALEALSFASRSSNLEGGPFLVATILPFVALGTLLYLSVHRLWNDDAMLPWALGLALVAVLVALGLYAVSEPLLAPRMDTGFLALLRLLLRGYTLAAICLIFVLTARNGWRSPAMAGFALFSGTALVLGGLALDLFDRPGRDWSAWSEARWTLAAATTHALAFALLLLGLRTLAPKAARSVALAGAAAVVAGGVAFVTLVFESAFQQGEVAMLVTQAAVRLAAVILLLAFGGVLSALATLRFSIACFYLVLIATLIAFVESIGPGRAFFWMPVMTFAVPAAFLLLAVVTTEVDRRTADEGEVVRYGR